MPSAEAFVDLDSPILKYLDFLLPLIELAVDRLSLSVTLLLIQRGYPCIPRSVFCKFAYLIGRNDGNESDGGLGNSNPVLWRAELTNTESDWIVTSQKM